MEHSHPSEDVDIRIRVGSPKYIILATNLYGYEHEDQWQALGDLLTGRFGWHVDLCNTGSDNPIDLLWSYGGMGESLLNVHVTPNGEFGAYDHVEDESVTLATIGELLRWVEEHEDRRDWISDFSRTIMSEEDWRLFRAQPWRVLISRDGGQFIATVDGVSLDVTFATTLAEVLRRAREMICDVFGAPRVLAGALRVSANLDVAAVDGLAD